MNFNEIEIIPSKGSSGAVVSIRDNLLLPESVEWPPIEVVGKFYESKHLKHFDTKFHKKLTKELGFYCDLQSIKSEDVITWSLFGYISKMDIIIQDKFYNELLKNINFGNDKLLSIELWKTLPHPEKLNSKGPEIDVLINGKKYIIMIECKWTSGIGRNQGINKDLDQMQIRKMFKKKIGKYIFPKKEYIIILVGNENIGNDLFISWESISGYNSLPHKEMFQNYLQWKRKYV